MASPECVYPWWGRNIVKDPEKHIHQTGQYKKHDPWENRSIQRKEKGKDQKKRKRHSLQVTLIPAQTCKLE